MRYEPSVIATATLLSMALLAGCSSSEDQSGAPAGSPAPVSATDGGADGAASGRFKAEMALHGAPTLSQDGQFIVVGVDLTNSGSALWASTGINPVKIGVHSIDAKGAVVENDLIHQSLPSQIAPGDHGLVNLNLPVNKTIGYSVQILPVYENVGWFDKWGTKPLTVGPFNACSDSSKGNVCDAAGNALVKQ